MKNTKGSHEESDKNLTIMAMVIARAWKDPSFRAELIAHPERIIKEEGYEFPPGVKFVVLENTANVRYLPLKRNLDLERDMNQMRFILGHLLPIQVNHEVRLVQSTDKVRYLVLPMVPASINADTATHKELMNYAIGEGITVNVTTAAQVQTVVTVTTEAIVAEVAAEVLVEVVAVAVAVAT